MGLTTHLGGLQGDDVKDRAVDREEHVQSTLQIILLELVGQVGAVQGVAGACASGWSGLGSHLQRCDKKDEAIGADRAR